MHGDIPNLFDCTAKLPALVVDSVRWIFSHEQCDIWQNFKNEFDNFLRVHLVFSKIMNCFWQILFAFAEIFYFCKWPNISKII